MPPHQTRTHFIPTLNKSEENEASDLSQSTQTQEECAARLQSANQLAAKRYIKWQQQHHHQTFLTSLSIVNSV